jgi:hypothetical protein
VVPRYGEMSGNGPSRLSGRLIEISAVKEGKRTTPHFGVSTTRRARSQRIAELPIEARRWPRHHLTIVTAIVRVTTVPSGAVVPPAGL